MTAAKARKIVLTGATRGLGRALTEAFIARGHIVYGCGRNAGHIEEMAHQFSTPNAFAVVDVVDANKVTRWAEEVISQAGPPDLLINNAAIMNTPAPLWDVPAKEFDSLIDINIKGVMNVLRAFLPAMLDEKHGVIVNLSSGWGRSTSPEVGPYCASKWAIEGLTQALSQELPRTMAAIALNPGIIDTDMLRECFGGAAGSYPSAGKWAEKAAPFLLNLGPKQNGQQLTAPG